MRIACIVLVLVLGFASSAIAGNVSVSITEGGKPVGQGLPIELSCGTNKHNVQTDASGSFKLFVKDEGKCALKLTYQGQTPSFDINSFDGPVRYDLILEKQPNGQYALKRK